MEAKLIKDGQGYKLKFYSDEDMMSCALGLLSLKNCQAIENGYDLDELATKSACTYKDLTSSTFMAGHYDGFKLGFKKALELMKHRLPEETEWDVEVERQCLDPNCDGINRKGCCIPGDKPKIDSEGCLILKRV